MTVIAVFAVSLVIGTWIGIRWAEASRRVNDDLDFIRVVMGTPLPPRESTEGYKDSNG